MASTRVILSLSKDADTIPVGATIRALCFRVFFMQASGRASRLESCFDRSQLCGDKAAADRRGGHGVVGRGGFRDRGLGGTV